MESIEETGGEARWLKRGEVGTDGYLQGWAEPAAVLRKQVQLDGEGYFLLSNGLRATTCDIARWEPALQMAARARLEIGDRRVCSYKLFKASEVVVNLRAQRAMIEELILWQARMGLTKVFTVDATRKRVTEERKVELRGARAGARHDGQVIGGVLSESEGIDNYLGELAAQIDVLNSISTGDRVAIIFDATSPVKCMQRFRRLCARARQCIHVGRWIEVMSKLVNRVESVVFIWQTSHVGEPVNEWADVLASQALWEPRLPVVRMPCDFASMTFPKRWRGDWYDQGSRSWAVLLLRGFVNTRLAGRYVEWTWGV